MEPGTDTTIYDNTLPTHEILVLNAVTTLRQYLALMTCNWKPFTFHSVSLSYKAVVSLFSFLMCPLDIVRLPITLHVTVALVWLSLNKHHTQNIGLDMRRNKETLSPIYHPNMRSDTCPIMPLLGDCPGTKPGPEPLALRFPLADIPCRCCMTGTFSLLPPLRNAMVEGASLIGVPKTGVVVVRER
jgi:hypothetical protein